MYDVPGMGLSVLPVRTHLILKKGSVMGFHKLGGLKQHNLLYYNSGGQKSFWKLWGRIHFLAFSSFLEVT